MRWKLEYSRRQFHVFERKTHLFETVNRKKNWWGILKSFYSVNRRINGDEIIVWVQIVVLSSGKTVWRTDWTFERRTSKGMFKRFHTNNYRFDCGFVLKYFSNWPIFRILNSYCKMFEKLGPLGPINQLKNWLAIPSNRLRGDRLTVKIIRFCFVDLYKGLQYRTEVT